MKFENWLRGLGAEWVDWWDCFYGLTPPLYPDLNWGAGYFWAEQSFDKPVEDRLKGWDLSFIVTWKEQNRSRTENLRQMRFGLGTAMLGDGYFHYSYDDRHPQWQPEFDWDFGTPLADFSKELYGADTLYVRTFSKGMVEVNPATTEVNGVSAQDTRFTFWVPVQDLTVAPFGPNRVRASWTAPHGDHGEPDSYELRYATTPITLESWDTATSYEDNPVAADPGDPVAVVIARLSGGQTWYFATRSHTRGRLEPALSNLASVEVDGIPDLIPPDPIGDLVATKIESSSIELAWTASGDDGNSGRSTQTLLRFLAGQPIDSEAAWSGATAVDGLGAPPPAGATDTFRTPGTAIRQPLRDCGASARRCRQRLPPRTGTPRTHRRATPAPPSGPRGRDGARGRGRGRLGPPGAQPVRGRHPGR